MRRALLAVPFVVAAVVGAGATWALYRFAGLLDEIERCERGER